MPVEFQILGEKGVHSVELGGLTGSFEVTKPAPPLEPEKLVKVGRPTPLMPILGAVTGVAFAILAVLFIRKRIAR